MRQVAAMPWSLFTHKTRKDSPYHNNLDRHTISNTILLFLKISRGKYSREYQKNQEKLAVVCMINLGFIFLKCLDFHEPFKKSKKKEQNVDKVI